MTKKLRLAMRMRLAAILGVLVLADSAAAQTRPASTPLLVSTAWLAQHLRDPDVVVLHTSQASAAREQIPGAQDVTHASLMTMTAGHDLASVSDLVAALEQAGVSNNSHVIVYGEPLASGWLFFALDYLGHERTSLLDGGLEKWKVEGRPLNPLGGTSGRGRLQPRLRPEVKASADAVQNRMSSAVALVDARSAQEFSTGHIPGAALLTWQSVYADAKLQVFRSPEQVAELFATAGAASGRAVITYCQIGLRSSLLYFAARYAGLNASNYVGSWSEWSSRGLPTVSGR